MSELSFMGRLLDGVNQEWRDNCVGVVACLAFQQQQIVEEGGVSSLAELNLLWP